MGSTGKVHAFEPFDINIEKLRNRISQNQFDDVVKIYGCALSNYQGEAEFRVFKENPGLCCFIERPWYDKSKMDIISVPVNYIDNLFTNSENIRLLKIDAEDADFDIIKGTKNNIKKSRPLIIFEGGTIKDNPARLYKYSKDEFIGFFNSIEYELYDTFGMRFNYALWNEKTLNDFVAIPKENRVELENLLRIAVYSVLLKYFTYSPRSSS